jgi:DNA polymerase-4
MDKMETARKTMHSIKDQFGHNKIMRAVELTDNKVIKDVIGFGSVKDLTDLDYAAIPRYD